MTATESTFALPAALTFDEVQGVLRSLETAVADGSGPLVVDGTAVTTLDSAAIALLLHTQRLVAARGRSLQWQALPAKLTALATLYGVDSLLSGQGSGAGTRSTPLAGEGASA